MTPNAELDAAVAEALRRARVAWPAIAVDDREFAQALASRVTEGADPVAFLGTLHVEDVYLAIACAAGTQAALAEFEVRYAHEIRSTVRGMGYTETVADETLQTMRHALFVAGPGAQPKILNYRGEGTLGGWLRAVAARYAIRVGQKSTPAVTELCETVAAAHDDLEVDYLKRMYGATFQDAFREALDALDPADRLLLKQRFRHQLGVEDLGVFYGVHASTVSRRVALARELLVAAIRKAMMRRLGIDRDDVSSILRLIQSSVDITLSTVA